MAGLNIKSTKKDKNLTLELSGTVDELAAFSSVSLDNINHLTINAKRIETINSWGVREWIKWVRTYPADLKVTIVGTPQVIVDQINLVAGFLPPGAVVETFYVPYYCNNCGNASNILFNSERDIVNGKMAESKSAICESCSSPAEWDVIVNSYFKFLTTSKK